MNTTPTPLTFVRSVRDSIKETATDLLDTLEEAISPTSETPLHTTDRSSDSEPGTDEGPEQSLAADELLLTWHLTPLGEQWSLKIEGLDGARRFFATKEQALEAGRETARNASGRLIVHRADGTIQRHLSYAA